MITYLLQLVTYLFYTIKHGQVYTSAKTAQKEKLIYKKDSIYKREFNLLIYLF